MNNEVVSEMGILMQKDVGIARELGESITKTLNSYVTHVELGGEEVPYSKVRDYLEPQFKVYAYNQLVKGAKLTPDEAEVLR